MKDITITDYGLRIEGRDVKPGSRLIFTTDAPAHFARFSKQTGAAELEVATPKDQELEDAKAEYQELFGSAPNGNMKLETIRAKIEEELAK